jgi:hypothetical protein
MIETNDSGVVNSLTASERARKVYQSLPAEKKEIVHDKLSEHRSTAWEHSIARRKGKALSEAHKAKLGGSKRGRTPKRGVPLWAIAEDALRGLPTTESANRRGGKQPDVYRVRAALGFPKGWPGAFRQGEVLTRKHVHEFCSDSGLTLEETAEFIGFGYPAFCNLVGKIPDRPLSSRHPKDPKSPHIGRLLREKYEHVVSRFCYERGRRWVKRSFLGSELLKLPLQHVALSNAFENLRAALNARKVDAEPEQVCEWVCREARKRQAQSHPSAPAFRLLLFFGLSLRSVLDEEPELLAETEGRISDLYWPRKMASKVLARDYGATAGGINDVVEGRQTTPLDPRLLCTLLRQELETIRYQKKKKRGPDPTPVEQTEWFLIGRMVEEEIPLFDSIFKKKAKLSRDVRKARLKCAASLEAQGCLAEHSEAASRSNSAKYAAICFVAGREELQDTSVRQYHSRYCGWLKKHPLKS